MERLVRIAALLQARADAGVSAEALIRAAGFDGSADPGTQISREIRHLENQGWHIENLAGIGEVAHYRMTTVDNRLRVRLTPGQQAALRRAVQARRPQRPGAPARAPGAGGRADPRRRRTGRGPAARTEPGRGRGARPPVLRFGYKGIPRVVHPESLRNQVGTWYLRGVEDGDPDARLKTFVVSRMVDADADEVGSARRLPAARHHGLHPMEWEVDPPVEVTLAAPAHYAPDVRRWLGEPLAVVPGADDTVLLRYRITNREALRSRLIELGRRVSVVAPDEVRAESGGGPGGGTVSTPPRYVARIARLPQVFEQARPPPRGSRAGDPGRRLRDDGRRACARTCSPSTPPTWRGSGSPRGPRCWSFSVPRAPPRTRAPRGSCGSRPTARSTSGWSTSTPARLGHVYTAALALLDIEPDNAESADAIDVLAETMFGEGDAGEAPEPAVADWNRLLPQFQRAREQRRAVRVVYSRAWQPGVSEREIEPYHLVQTRRGWEVDAGPVGPDGSLRTYLLSNIRSVEVLERTFEVPAGLEEPAGGAARDHAGQGGAAAERALGGRLLRRAGHLRARRPRARRGRPRYCCRRSGRGWAGCCSSPARTPSSSTRRRLQEEAAAAAEDLIAHHTASPPGQSGTAS
ncbi:WYL domain-containing protein [Nocardioides sp. W3-2-3]|uniref:WYL domain-containing protein n=1 Tax=Nocardioides convexus TaxID=2712224 RepID=UPI00241817EC|nr:WYL domain-containing protein [Nocardioides convexus]NHA00255.1 WYL domain-containing protein [Nocardioides convexus]